MIIPQNRSRYTTDRKLIMGRGFVDSFSNIFKSIRPALWNAGNNIGSFIKQNKDLLVKPIIGAVGDLAATGISKGVPALFTHIINRRTQKRLQAQKEPEDLQLPPVMDKKGIDILNSILKRESMPDLSTEIPTTNIIGDGLCKKKEKRKKYGSGLKNVKKFLKLFFVLKILYCI